MAYVDAAHTLLLVRPRPLLIHRAASRDATTSRGVTLPSRGESARAKWIGSRGLIGRQASINLDVRLTRDPLDLLHSLAHVSRILAASERRHYETIAYQSFSN